MRWRPRFSLRTLVVFMLLCMSMVGLWRNWGTWLIGPRAPRPTRRVRPSPQPDDAGPAADVDIAKATAILGKSTDAQELEESALSLWLR